MREKVITVIIVIIIQVLDFCFSQKMATLLVK